MIQKRTRQQIERNRLIASLKSHDEPLPPLVTHPPGQPVTEENYRECFARRIVMDARSRGQRLTRRRIADIMGVSVDEIPPDILEKAGY